ncbi:MAG: response regulator, partial [Chitinophagaceae bacterium]|nr:response regulator [Chitinophagaceae bacterium]
MEIYSCVIIDDEPRARVLLEAILETYCPQLLVKAFCEDLPSGVKAINKYQPDLVFLDIEMPGHSGLEILDFFDSEQLNFKIIFTTAYSEYALKAFKFSAIDYVLKPLDHTEIVEAVNRFIITKKQTQYQLLKALQQNLNTQSNWINRRLVLSTSEGFHFIQPRQIVFIKGESAYSKFYLEDGSTLLVSKNLKQFEEILPPLATELRDVALQGISIPERERLSGIVDRIIANLGESPIIHPAEGWEAIFAPNNLGYRMKLIAQLGTRRFQEILEPFALTPFHWVVLCCLWQEDGQATSSIGENLQQVGGTLTGVLDRMSERGLIRRERDAHDRRIWRIWLTDAGLELRQTLPPVALGLLQMMMQNVSEEEQELLSE